METPSQPDTNFIILGEAPGRLEDFKGKPFVGPAGQLLRKTLRKVGLEPDNAYYMNAVSCWPHGTPDDSHVRQCHDNLKAQLDAAKSQYVLACGSVALKALLPHAKLTPALYKWIPVHGKMLFPTYHPSYLLRNRDKTVRAEWERQLERFGLDINDERGVRPHCCKCIYCDGITLDGFICNKTSHKQWWRSDSTKWKRPIPPQLTLGV